MQTNTVILSKLLELFYQLFRITHLIWTSFTIKYFRQDLISKQYQLHLLLYVHITHITFPILFYLHGIADDHSSYTQSIQQRFSS